MALANFFSILLGLQEIEVICRPSAVSDRQAVAEGFGEVGLGCLYGIVYRLASCEMGCNGRGEGAAGAMRVGRLDELPFEYIEKIAVIKQIGGSFRREVTTFDQHMFAAEPMNNFGGATCVRERLDLNAGQLLGFMDVRRDE